jgi:hypothetical protein
MPILMFGAETWTQIIADIRRPMTTVTKFLRSKEGKTKVCRIRNYIR